MRVLPVEEWDIFPEIGEAIQRAGGTGNGQHGAFKMLFRPTEAANQLRRGPGVLTVVWFAGSVWVSGPFHGFLPAFAAAPLFKRLCVSSHSDARQVVRSYVSVRAPHVLAGAQRVRRDHVSQPREVGRWHRLWCKGSDGRGQAGPGLRPPSGSGRLAGIYTIADGCVKVLVSSLYCPDPADLETFCRNYADFRAPCHMSRKHWS